MNPQQILQQAQQTNSAESWLAAGDTLFQGGDYNNALQAYAKSQSLNPQSPNVYLQIASCCVELGMYPKALEASNILQQLAPNILKVKIMHANVLFHNGQYENAQKVVDFLLQQKLPDEEKMLTNKVQLSILSAYGDASQKEGICLRMLQDNPDEYAFLRILFLSTKNPHEHIELLGKYEKIADKIKGVNNPHDDLFFALADGFDKIGDYKKASKYLQRANAIYGKIKKCNISTEKRILAEVPDVFTREFFANKKFIDNGEKRMIFIVGMPRSSTSLIEQILASHSEVTGAGELLYVEYLSKASAKLLNGQYPSCLKDIDEEKIYELTKYYIQQVDKKFPDAQIIVDKLPQNFLHLGLIAAMFPNAKIINCVRDFRDIAISIYSKKFSNGNLWAQDFDNIYFMANTYKQLMQHWKQALPIEIYDSNYESLVNDFENEAKKLVEHCGLDWEAGCLQFYNSGHNVRTASQMQVKQPIFKSSLSRWQNYEPYFGKELKKLGELN